MPTQELLKGMNEALNREVSTFLRYVLQSAMIKGVDWAPVRSIYDAEIDDELGHAKYLANKMVMLGGSPRLAPDLSAPPSDVRDMLARDIEQERIDVQHYRKLATLADQEGLMDLKIKMEEQAADEERHGEQMRRLLG